MTNTQANGGLLRGALLENGLFSLFCGSAAITWGGAIAETLFTSEAMWFGFSPATGMAGLGVGLALFGVGVIATAAQGRTPQGAVKAIIALDLGWVALSALALAFASEHLTTAGFWTVGVLAAIVSFFALLQAVGLAILYQGESVLQTSRNGAQRHVKVTRSVAVPASTAWEVMVDHEAYADVAENLTRVEVLDGDAKGMCRKCYGKDGETWTETAHIWEEGKRYGFKINTDAPDYPYPLESLAAIWSVEARGAAASDVSIEFEVVPRKSLKGAIFVRASMFMFPKLLDRLLGRWAARMETNYAASTDAAPTERDHAYE